MQCAASVQVVLHWDWFQALHRTFHWHKNRALTSRMSDLLQEVSIKVSAHVKWATIYNYSASLYTFFPYIINDRCQVLLQGCSLMNRVEDIRSVCIGEAEITLHPGISKRSIISLRISYVTVAINAIIGTSQETRARNSCNREKLGRKSELLYHCVWYYVRY